MAPTMMETAVPEAGMPEAAEATVTEAATAAAHRHSAAATTAEAATATEPPTRIGRVDAEGENADSRGKRKRKCRDLPVHG
jgi:hypothetical protein